MSPRASKVSKPTPTSKRASTAAGAKLREIRIFLASPGDVRRERQYAKEVIDELNRTLAPSLRLTLRAICWECDAYPGLGKDAQDVLNPQIGWMSRYALFVT